MQEMTALTAIKTFFEMSMAEMKAEVLQLSAEERRELGELCCDALGATLKTDK